MKDLFIGGCICFRHGIGHGNSFIFSSGEIVIRQDPDQRDVQIFQKFSGFTEIFFRIIAERHEGDPDLDRRTGIGKHFQIFADQSIIRTRQAFMLFRVMIVIL